MAQSDVEMLAACGLDCGPCPIRRIPFDPEAAESMIAWFKQMGWLKEAEGVAEAVERGMYCKGCQGDKSPTTNPPSTVLGQTQLIRAWPKFVGPRS